MIHIDSGSGAGSASTFPDTKLQPLGEYVGLSTLFGVVGNRQPLQLLLLTFSAADVKHTHTQRRERDAAITNMCLSV